MTFTAKDVMERVGIALQDSDSVRWPATEMALWIDDALIEIANVKPSAVTVEVTVDLVEGTAQTIPDNASALVRAVCNVTSAAGIDPEVKGEVITPIERVILDQHYRGWHDTTKRPFRKAVKHITYDPATPDAFYVFPGNDGTGRVRLVIATILPNIAPAVGQDEIDIDSYTDEIPLKSTYRNAVVNYVLYKCWAKEDENPNGPSMAAAHLQLFQAALGIKTAAEGGLSPDTVGSRGS